MGYSLSFEDCSYLSLRNAQKLKTDWWFTHSFPKNAYV